MERRRTYLVTGGAGFIGSHLIERLLASGSRVVCYDAFDDYYDPSLKRARCKAFNNHEGCEVVEADICDRPALFSTFERFRPEVVVHLAALAGVRPSLQHPARYQRVNVEGTRAVLDACTRFGTRRLVNASSSSVYGEPGNAPATEESTPTRPLSPYGQTKLDAETLCTEVAASTALSIASLRFFTVYGPRQRPDMAITRFAQNMLAGQPVLVYGDGSAQRDFTFVEDIVSGIVSACELADRGHLIANLGTGNRTSLHDVLLYLAALCGREPLVTFGPRHETDALSTWADISLARAQLGYRPRTPLRIGLAAVVDSLRAGAQPFPARTHHRAPEPAPRGSHPWPQSTTA